MWKTAFEVFGALDWRRLDLLFARETQMQLATPLTLRDCILFPAPEDIQERLKEERQANKEPQTIEEALAIFGH